MTKIKNENAYPIKLPLTGNEIMISSDRDDEGTTRNILLSDIASYVVEYLGEVAPAWNQDNKGHTIRFDFTGDVTLDNFADTINALPSFTIDQYQNVFFKGYETGATNPKIVNLRFITKGKGTYGTSGTNITAADLEIHSITDPTAADFELDPNTVTIDYGDIDIPIEDWLNGQTPSIAIQSQTDGYTIFTGTINGLLQEYLWIGSSGSYGSASPTATFEDFTLINNELELNFLTAADVAEKLNAADLLETNWVAYGLLPTTSLNLSSFISLGAAYYNRKRIFVGTPTLKVYTALKDTYVYITPQAQFVYVEVANGASAPTNPAGCFILAKVVTSATAITSVLNLRATSVYINRSVTITGILKVGSSAVQSGVTMANIGDGYGYFDFAGGNHDSGQILTLKMSHLTGVLFTMLLGYFKLKAGTSELLMKQNGEMTAPNLSIGLINSGGAKSLATKEYADSLSGGTQNLQSVTGEGNHTTDSIYVDYLTATDPDYRLLLEPFSISISAADEEKSTTWTAALIGFNDLVTDTQLRLYPTYGSGNLNEIYFPDRGGTVGVIDAADNYANDAAAAIGGIAIGELYHTSGVVKIRLT